MTFFAVSDMVPDRSETNRPETKNYPTGVIDMEKSTEKMKNLLLETKREILDKLVETNADFRAIVEEMDPKDFADVASDDIDRKMLEALGTQELKRLRQIDAALVRIQQGRYGLCMKCGKKIPSERLHAIPYAVMCIECQKGEERRNR